MPHPRSFIVKLLLLSLTITATILIVKPSHHFITKAQSCPTTNPNNPAIKIDSGFLSVGTDPSSFTNTDHFNYNAGSDPNSNCIVSSNVNIDSDINTFDAFKQNYFINSNYPYKCTVGNPGCNLNFNPGGSPQAEIFYVPPSQTPLKIKNVGEGNVNSTYVVFVDGDLEIQNDIDINSGNPSNEGIVFITKGNVNIDSTVTKVKAFFINYGAFCDTYDSNGCDTNIQTPISFIGSIISLSNTQSPSFVRQSNNPLTTPGEAVTYDPKYFVILKDMLSKDKTIWTEIK